MSRPIMIDLDGVLAQFDPAPTEIANRLWPGKIPTGYRPGDWYWSDVLNKKEWDAIWDEIIKTPDFWLSLSPYPESLIALSFYLGNENPGQVVYFITSRTETAGLSAQAQSERWLNRYGLFPRHDWLRYGQRSRVIRVEHPSDKRKWVEDLNIGASLDDKIETVRDLQKIPGHAAFLMDRSWNRNLTGVKYRVNSMAEFLQSVAGL